MYDALSLCAGFLTSDVHDVAQIDAIQNQRPYCTELYGQHDNPNGQIPHMPAPYSQSPQRRLGSAMLNLSIGGLVQLYKNSDTAIIKNCDQLLNTTTADARHTISNFFSFV